MSVDFWHPDLAESINVSNSNAAAVLTYLGLPFEIAGDLDARDLLTRCALARHAGRGLDLNGGVDPDHPVDDGGLTPVRLENFLDCGRRPGYLADRLEQLERLAALVLVRGEQTVHYG